MRTRTASAATTTACALLLAVVPAVLIHLAASTDLDGPWTATLQEWIQQPLTAGFLAVLAYIAAWLLWALLATAVTGHAYTQLTRMLRWLPALHLPGPLRSLTAAILGVTAISASAVPAHAAGTPTVTTSDEAVHPPRPAGAVTPTPHAADRSPGTSRPEGEAPNTYTVRHGDTLSGIAQRCLGDADRWRDIFAVNRGTHFKTGGTLRDPDLIYPGWTLQLPTTARDPHQATPPAQKTSPTRPEPRKPQSDATPPPAYPAPATTAQPAPPPESPSTATGTPRDDAAVSPTPTASRPASATTPEGRGEQRHARGVPLPTGSWVDLGLAVPIAAAVALVWAHRRRRYVPRKPSTSPRMDDPDLAPMPRVVNQIRRNLRLAAAQPDEAGHDANNVHQGAIDAHDPADPSGSPDEDNADGEHRSPDLDHARDDGQALPVAPALAHPLSAVWPPAGLGLTGPGADAAARGFLTAALATGGADHPDARTQVIMPSTTAAALLGAATINLPHTPRLTITAGLDEALEILEAQALHRTRLLYQHEVDTVTELRAADPYEEPVAPVMLLADTTSRHERSRIAALLTQGQRLDIHGVLLGAWPEGNTVHVAADGTTTPAADEAPLGSHPADVGRLTVLNPTETTDLLATLAESHTGQPPAPAPTEAPPTHAQPAPPLQSTTEPTPPEANRTDRRRTDEQDAAAASPITASTAGPEPGPIAAESPTAIERASPATDRTPTSGGDTIPTEPDTFSRSGQPPAVVEPSRSDTPAIDPPQAPTPPSQPDQVKVTVLGPPGIIDADPQRNLRAKSLELLVYLAVRDGSASVEAILDDLLPDAPASKAVHRLHTYVSDLRAVLRHNAGPGNYLTHPHHRYQLNPDRFNIDLWRMRAAIRAADTAASPPERIQALRRAVTAYRPLADGCEYEWLEPYRQAVRQEALDATIALIEELTDQPAAQTAVLDTALQQHPYTETLYQAAMRAHARLGHLDTIRALRRTLTRHLAEIDTEPADDTLTLADKLITDLRQPQRRTSPTDRPAA
ncbi:BTAD domain-containing putative transcriptional regulator [Micromonospora sp. NPDC007230]|uniref:BTAD domain-containing putative transcriptional regulator n=1 Tax=Micromonospora sp. NPDC007230 TaxID=3364237 RepID=UPI00368F97D0